MTLLECIDSIEKKAAEEIKAEQGDYMLDDLLHCGKCHTPKQTRVELFGQIRTPMCLCKCMAEKRDREEQERKRWEFEKRVKEMRRAGFPDEEMQRWTFAYDDHANEYISNIARNYVENFAEMRKNGKGLVLFGTVGTGKTFTAACIANALIDKGHPCLVTNFARLTNTISGMFEGKQEYIDKLNDYSLLVIDDLAAERNTEYMNEIVFHIIDSRYRAGLPIIITTNLTAQELKNPADMSKKRIYSRLFDMCLLVEVSGDDRRRKHLRQDFTKYQDMLGIRKAETT